MRHKRRSYQDTDDDAVRGEELATVSSRLDDLTRQLERMVQATMPQRPGATDPGAPDRVAEALARLDRRLDQVIAEGHSIAAAPRQARHAASAAPAASSGPAIWTAQILARQRVLDADPPAARPPATPRTPDLTALEQQLREINTQISSLHQPYQNALAALRADLAEIGRSLTEAMPKQAIEALEKEVRALAERLSQSRQAGADATTLATLERELAEIRDVLRNLTPAEGLAGFQEAAQALSQRIDRLSESAPIAGDAADFRQLEQAVASLRSVVSNVASDGALAQLAAEVHGLAAQFERAVPPGLETSIRALNERLDREQLSKGDQLAQGALEDRIVKLSEKLDASGAQLGHLEAIERGLADFLVYFEEMRSGSRGLRASVSPEAAPAESSSASAPTPAQAAVINPVPASRPASPGKSAAPPPEAQPKDAGPMRLGFGRLPIDTDLPPDTPLEPGSGAPRVKPNSAAARIAASEAALGHARPAVAETGGRSAAIAAARSAAQAAYAANVPKSFWSKFSLRPRWPFKRAVQVSAELPPQAAPALSAAPVETMQEPDMSVAPAMDVSLETAGAARPGWALSRHSRILRAFKTVLIAASVAIIVLGTAQTALDLLLPNRPSATRASAPQDDIDDRADEMMPVVAPPASEPSQPIPPSQDASPPPSADPSPTDSVGDKTSPASPSTETPADPPRGDITGSIGKPPSHPALQNSRGQAALDLPPTIGPVLQMAVAAHNPAAEYELGVRYAEGRGVTQSMPDAVKWIGRAADAGFAPAEFRLGSMNEKGDGLKKNLQEARRLYLAAANKGHAKAMHNLAVLYAEGVNGKPDYKLAAEWFRKAAMYGVPDSQYNLAILYAQGIGLPFDLAQSYRWFAIAAAKGDQDAAHKRDQVGAKLSKQALMAAKLAAQTFVPEREPDEATDLKVPPGGWNHALARPDKQPRISTR